MSRVIHYPVWCDRGWMPHHFAFVPSAKAWAHTMKKMEIKNPPAYPDANGRHMQFVPSAEGQSNPVSLVTIGAGEHSPIAVINMLYHEGVHVWQAMRETIGETAPSSEFEAYQCAHIGEQLIKAFEKSGRGTLVMKGKIGG